MNLEDFRLDDLGRIAAWLPQRGNEEVASTAITYDNYCINAFYGTAQQIELLEDSTTIINQGNSIQTVIGLWFISIEAFVNSLLRIACNIKSADFSSYTSRDLTSRISSLLDLLELDKKSLYQGIFQNPLQRLNEFKTFRNELFHDRTNEPKLEFHKTAFTPTPMSANQVDALQSAIIAIELFSCFRYVYSGLDLMPNIVIHRQGSFFFKRLDDLYIRILKPLFSASLEKHKLTSSLQLTPELNNLPQSGISKKDDIKIIIKSLSKDELRYPPSEEKTNIGNNLMSAIVRENPAEPKTFSLPNYYSDNQNHD